ncbi:hypothetical protein TNCV_4428881 [Trichonephila clavipes]|nr:hypothetical protein TNCV_4428881 [Trichonephila clavipes]
MCPSHFLLARVDKGDVRWAFAEHSCCLLLAVAVAHTHSRTGWEAEKNEFNKPFCLLWTGMKKKTFVARTLTGGKNGFTPKSWSPQQHGDKVADYRMKTKKKGVSESSTNTHNEATPGTIGDGLRNFKP